MATLAAVTPAKSHKGLWLTVAGVIVLVVAVAFMLPNTPNLAAGLSLRELIAIEAILFTSGLMSGLSGFGFSAVGASTLLFLAPTIEAPLLANAFHGESTSFGRAVARGHAQILGGFLVKCGPLILHSGCLARRFRRYLDAEPPSGEAVDDGVRFVPCLVLPLFAL